MSTIAEQIQQVDEFLEQMTAHHWDEAVDSFAGDSPRFEDMSTNVRLSGRSGIASGTEAFATALPDLKIKICHAADVPGYSVREVVIAGTHLGNYQGLEATGQHVSFSCAFMFEFDSCGRLKTERLYFDNETLLRQMHGRVLPYLPAMLRLAA